MQDITIEMRNQDKVIELAHKIKSIDEANSLYFEENKESTLKIIDKVIINLKYCRDSYLYDAINLINQNSNK